MSRGWRKVPFADVISDESGGNLKTLQSAFLCEGRHAVVDQGKDLIAGYVNDDSLLSQVELPVIVFGDHTRCFKYVDFPFCMGADGVKVLRPKIEANVKYLYYYLRQLQLTNQGYQRHFKYLKRCEVQLPPLPEQQRIAEVLGRVEELRAKRRTAVAQLDTLSQAIFLDLFGDPATNPRGWPLIVLGDVITSASDGPHVSPRYAESGIPFLSTRHIRGGGVEWIDLKFITPHDAETHWLKCRPQKGDVLYTKGGTTGIAVAIDFDKPIAIWVHVALLKTRTEIVEPRWLEGMLNSSFCYQQSQRLTHGIANRDLGLKRMTKIKMFLPPLSLQCDFARRVAAVEKLKTVHRASLAELDALFASLQHRAFRGEL